MPFLIYYLDREDMDVTREKVRQAHRDHLRAQGDRILAAGALLDDDGERVIGGIILLDTDDRVAAERFAAQDPFELAGLRAETKIIRWRRRWWNGNFFHSARVALFSDGLPLAQEVLPNSRWNRRAASAVPSLTIVLARRSPKR